MQPLEYVQRIQRDFDEMRFGSSEGFSEALPWAMLRLAELIAFAVGTAYEVDGDTLGRIVDRQQLLLNAGRMIAKREKTGRGPQGWGATDA